MLCIMWLLNNNFVSLFTKKSQLFYSFCIRNKVLQSLYCVISEDLNFSSNEFFFFFFTLNYANNTDSLKENT